MKIKEFGERGGTSYNLINRVNTFFQYKDKMQGLGTIVENEKHKELKKADCL